MNHPVTKPETKAGGLPVMLAELKRVKRFAGTNIRTTVFVGGKPVTAYTVVAGNEQPEPEDWRGVNAFSGRDIIGAAQDAFALPKMTSLRRGIYVQTED